MLEEVTSATEELGRVIRTEGGGESESRSVVSDSLQPRGRYSPWNSPGQNMGVHRLSLLQGIFPTPGSNPDVKPRSPPFQVDSLPGKPQGKPEDGGGMGEFHRRGPRRFP